uniref:Tubulin--tyrosine ligase-like protein 9 n=1 Tax=Hanusia phi TaxID=3032 RepID=A0A7S0EH49_9CRYP|mmetsp:Transcript_24491/g.55259  ORF Transcript_24491/g.55259 Transcript_24491/m.55259 type:complete len:752 (+) Transcript_24491:46-2301(+)
MIELMAKRKFVICGNFPGVRDALLDRGWIESTEKDDFGFDLKWTVKTSEIDFQRLYPHQMVNHFAKNRHVTTKVGLSKSLRALSWFEDVDSDSFFPRCYDLDDSEDVATFVEDFMNLAAQNLLANFLARADTLPSDTRPTAQSPDFQQAVQALIACEDFVHAIDLEDIEQETESGRSRLSAEEWSEILGEPCPVAAVHFVVGGDIAETCENAVTTKGSSLVALLQGIRHVQTRSAERFPSSYPPDYDNLASRARAVLARISHHHPQSKMNVGENIWIVKPAGKSRGRGIELKRSLSEILSFATHCKGASSLNSQRWIVQKYVENPLLINNRKFDIRQWVLVTDWNPLTVWFYDECYLRFALSDYNSDALTDRFSHLCNNCVQKESSDFEEKRDESMWDLDAFRGWLTSTGQETVWQEQVLPQLQSISTWAVMCAQDLLENRKGSSELFGYDFLIDRDFHIWLIEINSSPDMSPSTAVTERLCYRCLYDTIRVMVDYKPQLRTSCPGNLRRSRSTSSEQEQLDEGCAPSSAVDQDESQDLDLKEVACDTGRWRLIHRGECEITMPKTSASKLCVEGTRVKIRRPGMKEFISKLGMDGTQRKSSIKISGSSKVYESRTQMLRDLNTSTPQLPPRFRFTEPSKSKSSSVKEISSLIERLNKWEEERKAKLLEKKIKEEREPEAEQAAPKARLSRDNMQSFLLRMDGYASRRVDKVKNFNARVMEGVQKLSSSSLKNEGLTKTRNVRLKRLRSMQ